MRPLSGTSSPLSSSSYTGPIYFEPVPCSPTCFSCSSSSASSSKLRLDDLLLYDSEGEGEAEGDDFDEGIDKRFSWLKIETRPDKQPLDCDDGPLGWESFDDDDDSHIDQDNHYHIQPSSTRAHYDTWLPRSRSFDFVRRPISPYSDMSMQNTGIPANGSGFGNNVRKPMVGRQPLVNHQMDCSTFDSRIMQWSTNVTNSTERQSMSPQASHPSVSQQDLPTDVGQDMDAVFYELPESKPYASMMPSSFFPTPGSHQAPASPGTQLKHDLLNLDMLSGWPFGEGEAKVVEPLMNLDDYNHLSIMTSAPPGILPSSPARQNIELQARALLQRIRELEAMHKDQLVDELMRNIGMAGLNEVLVSQAPTLGGNQGAYHPSISPALQVPMTNIPVGAMAGISGNGMNFFPPYNSIPSTSTSMLQGQGSGRQSHLGFQQPNGVGNVAQLSVFDHERYNLLINLLLNQAAAHQLSNAPPYNLGNNLFGGERAQGLESFLNNTNEALHDMYPTGVLPYSSISNDLLSQQNLMHYGQEQQMPAPTFSSGAFPNLTAPLDIQTNQSADTQLVQPQPQRPALVGYFKVGDVMGSDSNANDSIQGYNTCNKTNESVTVDDADKESCNNSISNNNSSSGNNNDIIIISRGNSFASDCSGHSDSTEPGVYNYCRRETSSNGGKSGAAISRSYTGLFSDNPDNNHTHDGSDPGECAESDDGFLEFVPDPVQISDDSDTDTSMHRLASEIESYDYGDCDSTFVPDIICECDTHKVDGDAVACSADSYISDDSNAGHYTEVSGNGGLNRNASNASSYISHTNSETSSVGNRTCSFNNGGGISRSVSNATSYSNHSNSDVASVDYRADNSDNSGLSRSVSNASSYATHSDSDTALYYSDNSCGGGLSRNVSNASSHVGRGNDDTTGVRTGDSNNGGLSRTVSNASSWGGETVIIEEIINPISGSMLEIEEVDALLSEDTDECNVDDSRGPVAMFGREHLLTNKHNWIGSSNQPLTRRHTTF